MAEKKCIVNRPGGVILHLTDGSSEFFAYGQEVDESRLTDYQKQTLHQYTDEQDRSAYRRDSVNVEHDAHRRAAFADAGQANSTSDPVPGNYGELSEEEAAQLVMSIGDPQVQARLLLHERVNHGSRQMVIDAGDPVAKAVAETLFGHLEQGGATNFDQTPIVDRERQVEREARSIERSTPARSRNRRGAQTQPDQTPQSDSPAGETPPPTSE